MTSSESSRPPATWQQMSVGQPERTVSCRREQHGPGGRRRTQQHEAGRKRGEAPEKAESLDRKAGKYEHGRRDRPAAVWEQRCRRGTARAGAGGTHELSAVSYSESVYSKLSATVTLSRCGSDGRWYLDIQQAEMPLGRFGFRC